MSGPLLVALDIDGTLLTYDEELSPAVAQAVAAVHAAGHHVVLATGRSVFATVPVAHLLGITVGWAVCSNGSVTVRLDPDLPGGHEIVETVTFDPGPAVRLMSAALPDACFAVEELGVGFRLTKPFPDGELRGEQTVVPLSELMQGRVTRLIVRSPEHTPEEFHELVVRAGLSDVTYAVGWTAWMDVAPEGVTKASALEGLRERLAVDPAATVAIGDGSNDVDMVRWAARGVAMGHSPVVLLDVADEVTGSIEQDGAVPVLLSLTAGVAGLQGVPARGAAADPLVDPAPAEEHNPFS